MHRLVSRVLSLLVLATIALPAPAQDLLLTGGTLVDPRTGEATEGDLLILDGVIAAAGEAPPEGFEGPVLDVAGKWIVPGLRDLHVHSFVNVAPGGVVERLGTPVAAERMLDAGVAGFLDLFNAEDYILDLRDRQRETGEPAGADVYAAGPCLTATDGHCTEYPIPTRVIDTPEDARREIGELAAKRPDVVKLVYAHAPEGARGGPPARPTLDRPTLEAAVAAAAGHGIPTVVHVESWRDVRDAVAAGVTAVTHVPAEAPVPDDLAALLAERGTVMIPTLVLRDTALATDPALREAPLLGAVAGPEILAAYRDFAAGGDRARGLLRWMERTHEVQLESVGRLAAAGVPIVAGTDAGNPWTVQGFSLHRELELLVAAGLAPHEALAAATTAAGDFLGRSWGLAPGDEGSVLVLDASPLADVASTRRIHAVVHHGRVVDRSGDGPSAPRPPRGPARVVLLGTFHLEDAGRDSHEPRHAVDVLSGARQREIEEVVACLAAFRPTKIAVEALPAEAEALDARFRAYRAGEAELSSDEIEQLGFRLAAKLGHERVHPVDAQGRGYDPHVDPVEFAREHGLVERLMASESPWEAYYTALDAYEDRLKMERTLREHLLHLNAPERILLGHGHDLVGTFKVNQGDEYPGVDAKTAWYNRNLRIFANLQRITEGPDERILLVIGSDHLPILRHAVRASPEYELVEVGALLSEGCASRSAAP